MNVTVAMVKGYLITIRNTGFGVMKMSFRTGLRGVFAGGRRGAGGRDVMGGCAGI